MGMWMNRTLALLCALLLTACGGESPFLPEYASIDLVIENGEIIDGLGGEPYRGDVVVVGEEIVFVGESAFTADDYANRVGRRVDAEGRVIAPGFIALHSHGDLAASSRIVPGTAPAGPPCARKNIISRRGNHYLFA